MKKYLLCSLLLFPFSVSSFAEMCTDFDSNQNLIEYECGTFVDYIEKVKYKEEQERIAQEEAARRAEQERIAKAEAEKMAENKKKAEEAAKRAEQEKLKAEEKAKSEEERAKQRAEQEKLKAEEKAKRDAERAKKRAERKQKWDKFWEQRHMDVFLAVGKESNKFQKMKMDNDESDVETSGLNLQLGVLFQEKDSNWKYGIRLDTTSVNATMDEMSTRVTGREYYADFMAEYNIWSGLFVYGGAGAGYVSLKKQFNRVPTHTDNEGFFAGKVFVGIEYDIIKYIGVFAENSIRYSNGQGDMGFVVGGKVIF